jgi:hypothetical protein
MPPPLPRRSGWTYSSLVSSCRISLPRKGCRVGLRIVLFEACSAFTHVAACTLARSPIRDPLLPEGFSHFVSSMTAPVASGGSEIAGWAFHPLERCRLSTAHTHSSPSQLRPRRQRLANSARSASRFRDAEPDARVRTIEWPRSIQSGLRPFDCSRQRSLPVAQESRSLSPPSYHPTARSPLSRSLPQSNGRGRPGQPSLRSGVVLCR